MKYELRTAAESDIKRIFECYRITVGPYVEKAWGWDELTQISGFWKHHPLEEFKVIEIQNEFAGGLHLEEDQTNLYIRMIFLLPIHQGNGIGSQVITDIHNIARRSKKSLMLKVIKCNPAKDLYKRLGFELINEDETTQDMLWV